MKVAVGVPTFNRQHLVALNAASLRESYLPDGTELIVIDDASSQYDTAYLRSIYPANADIRQRAVNSGGASFAIRELIQKLLETGADAVLLLDSDMIVSKRFLKAGIELLAQTEGLLSLFNTPNHPSSSDHGALVVKASVGSAGTLWRRDVVIEMLSKVPAGVQFDWRFSRYFNDIGKRIYIAKQSLVQHAGFADGQNCDFFSGDFGVGFHEAHAGNAYRVTEVLMSDSQAKYRDIKLLVQSVIAENNARYVETRAAIRALTDENRALREQLNAIQNQNVPSKRQDPL